MASDPWSGLYSVPSAQNENKACRLVSTASNLNPDFPGSFEFALPHILRSDSDSGLFQEWTEGGAKSSGKEGEPFRWQDTPSPPSISISSDSPASADMATEQNTPATTEDAPIVVPSRRRTPANGLGTPATPSTNPADSDADTKVLRSEFVRPRLELQRTESAAFQDELYNPANFDAPTPARQQPRTSSSTAQNQLSTPTNNLVNQRVAIANSVRSRSPVQALSRVSSPFRQGSELAPPASITPASAYSTARTTLLPSAASIRLQQKEQADQKEIQAHQPRLKRELTKTISPKDAVLDAPDPEQASNPMSLFNDIIPPGYQKHLGGSEQFPNNFVSGTNQAFGQFVPMSQASNMGGFRGLDLNNWLATPVTNAPATATYPAPFGSQQSDKTPEFPANLTSMESSVSENPPASSQESAVSPQLAPIQRPENTSANTGTYACTNVGCTQRFESPAKLTRHKREAHQPTPSVHSSATPDEDDESSSSAPSRSTSVSGMTSSSVLGKNSPAGQHKCTRINPTTGKPCNTIFSRPYDLTRHEDTIHNKAKQKIRCQYCREEKTFSRNDALTRHMKVVHQEIEFQGKRARSGST